MPTSHLTADLTAEYGDLVPPALIAHAVDTAAAHAAGAQDEAVAAAARADVAALADAVRRAPVAAS